MTPATTTPTLPAAGGRLVLVESAMGYTPPRLMVAPRGVRLPPGVHEVAQVLVLAAGPRDRLPRGARAVVAAATGDGRAALGLGCFSSSAPAGAFGAGCGTRVTCLVCTGAARAHPGVAAAAAGLVGAGSSTAGARGAPPITAADLCFGGAASMGTTGFRAASPNDGSSRRSESSYVPRALDLGDAEDGEEYPSDELRYQEAYRQMRAAVYLVCLRSRVEVASDLGLLPSGRERRMLLEVIGDINAAAPIYHWVISRCHNRFGAILGSDLYKKVIGVNIIMNITTLMVEIQYSIMHNETWRAVVRDHPLYDMCHLFLNKLVDSVAEFSINLDLACFKRPSPPVIQRMMENHALAVVHLYEVLLDFYEVLSSGEQAADPKKTKELLMRYDFLFVQDLDPQDYIFGAGATDAEDLLFLLEALKPEVRSFRGAWN